MADVFLRRVRLRNFKSIPACDVALGPLTFLVGPNGSGKSNFLDALRLTSDALSDTLDSAFRERGGVAEVRRRSKGHPNHFAVSLDFCLPDGALGFYYFEVAARKATSRSEGEGWYEVREERCTIDPGPLFGERHWYIAQPSKRTVTSSLVNMPRPMPDRLYLQAASGFDEFRQVYDALVAMKVYNLNPDEIRAPQAPDPGRVLARDGWNIASVVGEISKQSPETNERITEFLGAAVPGITEFNRRSVGQLVSLDFRQTVAGDERTWSFPASSMSDGTLRALAVLVALFQSGDEGLRTKLVGIEEPEAAIHPAALAVLFDALCEASLTTQVIVTSHSADLIDLLDGHRGFGSESLLAVEMITGNTVIGELDDVGKSILRERLFTPGDLLRNQQLLPDETARMLSTDMQLDLLSPDSSPS
ncbi:MAG: AAA family ATPase [Acidimicrobiales bacterium]|jgi:predicted ATPase